MRTGPTASPDSSHFERRVAELRAALSSADPIRLAESTGARYQIGPGSQNCFHLPFFGQEVRVSFPEFIAVDPESGKPEPVFDQALLAYYFYTADGTYLAGRWVSFGELPGGRFYNQAYQGYSGQELSRNFGDDWAGFQTAAQSLGGLPLLLGDGAFTFQSLPRVPLLAVFWQGDEDFPSSYQILFDASATHYLPVDVCAILGGRLARKLISARSV
ncbi:MAG TPA: DUF3786 domain-containing protein [Anaerolineales bacterium]